MIRRRKLTILWASQDPPPNSSTGTTFPPDQPPTGTVVEDDPTAFDSPPTVVSTSGSVQIKGKKKSTGSIAKLLQDISSQVLLRAGHTYTMQYSADWSQMTAGGVNNEVGFIFKANNDFYMVGLKGAGVAPDTTVHQIQGPNDWNRTSGFIEIDGGAPHNGTLSGPNFLQIVTSNDGTTINFLTGNADGSIFTAELSLTSISPFANVSEVTNWGPGVFLDASDDGPFSIDVTVWNVETNPAVTYLDNDYAALMAIAA